MAIKIDQPVGTKKQSIRDSATAHGLLPPPGSGRGPIDPNSTAWAPRAPINTPTRPTAPKKTTARSTNYGSSYSGGGGGGGSYGGGGSSLGVSAAPSEEDYLKGDATYQATLSALAKQLSNYTTDIDSQLSSRKLDYENALQQLGFIAPAEGGTPSWNFTDAMTASGRSYQQMLNDFASRGMIQSQVFGDAQNDLTRTLNKQYEGMNTSNQQFLDDMERQKTKAADENKAAEQAARAEAILRRATQYGFGV